MKYHRVHQVIKSQEVQHTEIVLNFRFLNMQTFTEYSTNRSLLLNCYKGITLKLHAYIKRLKAIKDMIAKLTLIFRQDSVFVMGNYSAPNVEYHKPIRDIGFRKSLENHGF
jgi:hypothetical protein